MNLVGKIFTVLIFAMCLVFMTCAVMVYGTQRNWKLAVDNPTPSPQYPLGLSQQLAQKEELLKKEQEKYSSLENTLKRERDAAIQARAKLENAAKEARDELKAVQQQLEAKDQELRAALAELKNSHDELERRRAEVSDLRDQITKAREDRDKYFADVVKKTDEVHQLANENARIKAENLEIARQYSRALEVLRKFDLQPQPELYESEPPVLDSVVTAVLPGDVVEIKLGHDDGLRPGHQLTVSRIQGGVPTLVAFIEVVKTTPDTSVCKVVPGSLRSPIQRGDRVDTKQNRPQPKR